MRPRPDRVPRLLLLPRRPVSLALPLVGLALAACTGSTGNGSAFEVHTITGSVDPTLSPLVSGSWLVYGRVEALEAGGTDLNGDGDTTDVVATAVPLGKDNETVIGVASTEYAGLSGEILLSVEESEDGKDWNGDMDMSDRVLLHWSNSAGGPTYVDTLAPTPSGRADVTVVGTRAYYASDATGLTGDETNLRYVTKSDPTTPVVIENTLGGGVLHPKILGESDSLLFLSLDEAVEGGDLNGDADATDGSVLALLNGLDPSQRVVSVGLAMRDDSAPFAAHFEGGLDWVVGFLVDEASQGNTNLNPTVVDGFTVVPDSCIATPDTDTFDQVLHWLRLVNFTAGTDTAHNSGIAGSGRVVAVNDYVATLSSEFDSTCDYNEDGDLSDTVVRWRAADATVEPPRDPSQLHAVKTSLPGGSMGLATLFDRLVSVVDEAQDSDNIDGKAANHDLVGWLDPKNGGTTTWTFAHQSSNPNFGTGLPGEPYAGASWMAPDFDDGRLGVAFEEQVPNLDLNTFTLGCNIKVKDGDKIDSLPVWLDFEAGPTLDFDGLGFAIVPDDAGITVSRGWVFFKLDEADDNTDYNNDGDKNDVLIMRNPVTSCFPRVLGTGSSQKGPAVFTDDQRGAAFLSSEFQAGKDLNGDGDSNDTVISHFTF